MIVDTYILYEFLKRLTTPFNQMPAFKLGLIDEQGNFLKNRNTFNTQENDALTKFDVLIINLKRLLAKVPGGSSQIGTFAAALYLMKEEKNINESSIEDSVFELENKFNMYMEEVAEVLEDAPVNSTAGIAGLTADGLKIPPKSREKYKRQNISTTELLKGIIKRRMPAQVGVAEDTTLEYHNELNSKIWVKKKLKPEVRGKLLQIASAWRDFAKIPDNLIDDIIITGGNVNYNYTPQSDIDLHLVVDRSKLNPDRDFVDEYLQDKKILWTLTHPDITIYGYPVELYAQDPNEHAHFGQGVYSVKKDAWVQSPEYLGLDFESNSSLQNKVQFYKDMIDKLIDQKADSDTIDALKKKIRTMRGDSIAKGGEFAFGNLIFKDLRNQGYLDKINDYERSKMDQGLSL